MTARNREERSDSDTIRLIRQEAYQVCSGSKTRIWWAIGIIVMAMLSITGGGVAIAINDHGKLLEQGQKISANERTLVDMKATLIRMDDKLDALLRGINRR